MVRIRDTTLSRDLNALAAPVRVEYTRPESLLYSAPIVHIQAVPQVTADCKG